jgi:hypothetical protein
VQPPVKAGGVSGRFFFLRFPVPVHFRISAGIHSLVRVRYRAGIEAEILLCYGTRKGLKRNKKPYDFLFSEFCEAKLHSGTSGFLLERKARFPARSAGNAPKFLKNPVMLHYGRLTLFERYKRMYKVSVLKPLNSAILTGRRV